MAVKIASKPRRKEHKNVTEGNACIESAFNSAIVSITDPAGVVIVSASSGQVGSKGSYKPTFLAARLAAEAAVRRVQKHGMKEADIYVKGPGSGWETAICSLQATGLEAGSTQDTTPQVHNGYRPPERRRV